MYETCRPDLKALLSVSYTGPSLEAPLLNRHEGVLEISSQDLDVDLGADSVSRRGDPVRYRKSVKDFVRQVLLDGKLEGILLAGCHNEDVLFKDVLSELAVESQQESLERLMALQAKDMGDGVWCGARGAAVITRRGMWMISMRVCVVTGVLWLAIMTSCESGGGSDSVELWEVGRYL